MRNMLREIRNHLFGINEIKKILLDYIHYVNPISTESKITGKYNKLTQSLVDVEQLYSPINGGFYDNNGNLTYTNMELESAYLISSLVAIHRPNTVLETGTHEGYSAAHMARAIESLSIDSHIFTFDPFEVPHRFENNSLEKYVTWIKDFSTNYQKYNLPESFDFILLDSDHTYKTLAQEVNIFEPMLKVDGLLVLHDTIVFKDLWPVVDSIKNSKRFEIITLDTPRTWGQQNGLNGSGLTICRKLAPADPIPINQDFLTNENIDKYISTLSKDRIHKSARSMFFNNQ